ncbi:MAG: hypothetical protein EPO13_11760 [Actinomycetota bacterium]|nr:MAG: hypothetical protein EPO13_11760 [Actinomycetota bacterium]
MSGVRTAGRAEISARTLRTDAWWVQPAITAAVLIAFVIYSTWRAFENAYYYAAPYISPFYSPCLATSCGEASHGWWTPVGGWWTLSPALLILVFPLGFRLTCYYYRKAYYRSFWLSPPACAVAEPHRGYSGETRFPLIVQNAHRWFFYVGLIFNVILTYDAIVAFRNPAGQWGHMGLGTLILLTNATLLWLYSASCHTCRHTIGGRLTHFSRHPLRYKAWTWISGLNARHAIFAWISLFGVALTDLYVRLLAAGTITDITFF